MKNILSLFDGMSCAKIALERLGIPNRYFASEIDKHAIHVSKKNYKDIVQLGDVEEIDTNNLPKIDLLVGGSPCQDLSIGNTSRKGLEGQRSKLFWNYVTILNRVSPRYFLLENVASMSDEDREIITRELGVEPIMINSSLVSAQQRKRYYWTNIPGVTEPEDRGIYLYDILEDPTREHIDQYVVKSREPTWTKDISNVAICNRPDRIGHFGKGGQGERIYSILGKSICLSSNGGGMGAKTGLYLDGLGRVRRLTPIECERLQTVPDNYTEGVSDTQRYKMLGNGFTVEVIAHILSFADDLIRQE